MRAKNRGEGGENRAPRSPLLLLMVTNRVLRGAHMYKKKERGEGGKTESTSPQSLEYLSFAVSPSQSEMLR